MKVKIKKTHPDAVIPRYAKAGDAGLDLTAVSASFDNYGNVIRQSAYLSNYPGETLTEVYEYDLNNKEEMDKIKYENKINNNILQKQKKQELRKNRKRNRKRNQAY